MRATNLEGFFFHTHKIHWPIKPLRFHLTLAITFSLFRESQGYMFLSLSFIHVLLHHSATLLQRPYLLGSLHVITPPNPITSGLCSSGP